MAKSKNTILASLLTAAGDIAVSGSGSLTGDLTVQGRLTAQEYHSEIVSSSILYTSGSTKFGDSADDTHQFTGSVNISGSILVNGVAAVGPQGATGSQGATGTQGPTGFQGATGIQGSIGAQGNTGPTGLQGTVGAQGDRGFQGFTGPQGTTGAQGNQGPTGAQGNQGPAGPGVSGTQGYLSKFTSSSTIGDSIVQDLSTYISVGGYAQFNRGTLSFTLNPSYGGGNVYTQLQSTGALALATGGDSNKVYINTSGDVGIGTTTPSTSLHIVRSTNVGLRLTATASNGSAELDLLSHGTQNAFIDYGPNQLRFRSTNSDMSAITSGSVLVLQNDGSVGIGTTSPARTLHVMGQAAFDMTTVGIVIQEQSSTAQIVSYKQTGGTYADLHLRGANLGIVINGTNGNVGIGNTSPEYRLDVAGVINSNSSGTGTLNLGFTGGSSRIAGRITGASSPSYSSTGRIGFSVTTWGVGTDYGLTEVMAIDMQNADNKNPVIWMNPFGGNVGIGTTTPGYRLDVSGGTARIQNNPTTNEWGLILQNTNTGGWGVSQFFNLYGYSSSPAGDFSVLQIRADYPAYGRVTFAVKEQAQSTAVDALVLRGNGQVYMNAGNVGIGTTSPSIKLDIQSSISGTGLGDGMLLKLKNTSTTTNTRSGINFGNIDGVGGSLAMQSSILKNASTGEYDMTWDLYGGSAGWKEGLLYLDSNPGNVGIGTQSPTSTLHVRGLFGAPSTSGSSQNGIARFGQTAGNGVLDIGFGDPYSWLQSRNTTDYSTNYNLSLQPNGGNVGIGTTSPTYKLDVNGGAADTTLRVQTTGQNPVRLRLTNEERDFILTNNPADDLLSFFYADANRLQFNTTNQWFNSGNVGINTSSPTLGKLQVTGDNNQLAVHTTGTYSSIYFYNGSSDRAALYCSSTETHLEGRGSSGLFFGGAVSQNHMVITSGGNVGINTTSPSERLHIVGNIQLGSTSNQYIRYRTQSAWDYYLKADFDDFVINDSQNTEFFRAIYNGGGTGKYAQFLNSLRAHNNTNVTVLGTLTENSSIRYKENVETIKYSLDKILQMRGVSYTKKDTGLKELGLIAEEVNEILPEVVLKNEEGEPDSVSYSRITAVLIEAIKDLQQQINVLNSK